MTNPVALTTTVWGNGPQRALLLHGMSSAGSTWWRVAPALVDVGYTVVAPDLRGHGTSPAGDELSMDAYRDDVLLLGNGWDLLVGHSLGGAVAIAAMTARPGFAKRLVLEDPALDSEATERFIASSPEPTAHPTVEAVASQHPGWHPRDVELKVEALLQSGVEAPKRTMEDAAPWDMWDELAAIGVPALVVGADPALGTLLSVEKVARVVRSNPGVRFETLTGPGHSIHRDDLDHFVAVVLEYVANP
jgi:pimeloyl-ACP methyl ester carboxylesterase